MDFAEAVKAVFNKYAVFSGRSLRSEFWYWELFGILASIVLSIVDSALFNSNFGGNGPGTPGKNNYGGPAPKTV
jgi:uncharacterized membrane protein YhaH (DUF805 family)